MSTSLPFSFTEKNLKEYQEILSRYDDIESALLPVLHLAQEQHGYLPTVVVEYISSLMGIPKIKIQEVISFYDMFYDTPTAKKIVQVCTNITCSLYGGRKIHQELLSHYNTQNMVPTKDGEIFIQKMECLGACEIAPCIRVGNDYYGPIQDTQEALNKIKGESANP